MSHRIESHAKDLAGMLDSGQGQQVAQILRQDMQSMSDLDFNKLIKETIRQEKSGCGDDLVTNASQFGNGTSIDVVVNRRDKNGSWYQYADTVKEWSKPVERDYSQREEQRFGCPPRYDSRSQYPNDTAGVIQKPWERSGYNSWNNYYDYNNSRDYDHHRHGVRPEEFIIPLLGIGLTAAFANMRHSQHQHYQQRQYFYPQTYNNAPSYYNTTNYYQPNHYHQRRYF